MGQDSEKLPSIETLSAKAEEMAKERGATAEQAKAYAKRVEEQLKEVRKRQQNGNSPT